MAPASSSNIKVLHHYQVAPPPGSVPPTSLPLTFFDIPWIDSNSTGRLFLYEYPYNTNHFMQIVIPSLKHSLSLTLQYFFPFAGNLIFLPNPKQKPYILYANGDSISFTVSESIADFNDLVACYPRDVKVFHPLIPRLQSACDLEDGSRAVPLMAIQVTLIPYSGFIIGVKYHHVAADGRSFHHFMKSWASICKTREFLQEFKPSYKRDEIKDPNELEMLFRNEWWLWQQKYEMNNVNLNMVRVTIVVGRAQLQKLKDWFFSQYINEFTLVKTHISTYVLICALIWVCLLKSQENILSSDNDNQVCCFAIAADCRNRYEFSIPTTYFGNCLAFCYAFVKRKDLMGEFGYFEAVKAIGSKVKELESGAFKDSEKLVKDNKDIITLGHHVVGVASSSKFKVYQTDFGLGKLKKCEVAYVDTIPTIALSESRDEEGGLEVGLALEKPQMDKFSDLFNKFLESK